MQQPPEQYYTTMSSSYPLRTPQMPGQERNIQQPPEQYYITMSSPSYPLLTSPMPGIGQARQTIQRPTEHCYTMTSIASPPVINMMPHSTPQRSTISMPQSSTIPPDDQFAVSEKPFDDDHSNAMSSLKSSRPGRTVFPSSSSRVANTSISAVNFNGYIDSSGASNRREAASMPSSSTHKNHPQSNAAMMGNTARPEFPTANSIPYNNNSIPMMPNNAPGPQNIYAHPPATNMNQHYGVPSSHNPPSFHRHLNGNATYSPQYISSNTDLSPPNSYTDLSSYPDPSYHDSGAHRGSHQQQWNPAIANSQPAGPSFPDQPAPAPLPLPAASPQPGDISYPDPETHHSSTTLFCRWRVGDHTCPFEGPLDAFKKHFRSSHLTGAQASLSQCHWQGCKYHRRTNPNVKLMRRDSAWRHVRETHLGMKRST